MGSTPTHSRHPISDGTPLFRGVLRRMTMDVEFVSYAPRFRDQVIDLQRRVFGGSSRSAAAFFEWKYEENPYLPGPLFALALEGDGVVGMRGFYGERWVAGDSGVSAVIPVGAETAIDPEYRGRWLFEAMVRYARTDLRERGYDFTFNFSANDAVRVLSLRAGWQRLMPYGYLQFHRGRSDESSTVRAGGRLGRARQRIRYRLGWRSPEFAAVDRLESSRGIGVSTVATVRAAEMAALVDRERRWHLGQARDEAHYRWRFGNPRFQYRFLYAVEGAGLEAFFVLQQPRGGGLVSIVDWCATSTGARGRLLQALLGTEVDRLQIWSATLPPDFLEELHAAGFEAGAGEDSRARPLPGMLIDSNAEPGLSAEDWSLGGIPLLDPTQWDLRMLDSDAY